MLTGPLPPQNITAGSITACQIILHWMLPVTRCAAGWEFAVLCEDVSSGQQWVLNNITKVSGTNRNLSYTVVIGGLESYTRYRIEVFTVTQFGIWSCRQVPLIVQTGKNIRNIASYYPFLNNEG